MPLDAKKNKLFLYLLKTLNVVHQRALHPTKRCTKTSKAYAQQRSLAAQHKSCTLATVQYYLEASLSFASSISTLQVRELCPISLQRPQRLSARTLFAGVSLSSRPLPSLSAIKSNTLLTVRVSSARTYRLLRVLCFVSVLTAS